MQDTLCFHPCPSKVAKIELMKNCAYVESRNAVSFVQCRGLNAHAMIDTGRYS
jgi:hypothetical protein